MVVVREEPRRKFNKEEVKGEIINYLTKEGGRWRVFLDIPYCDLLILTGAVKEFSVTIGTTWAKSEHKKQEKILIGAAFKVVPETTKIDPLHHQFWDELGVSLYVVPNLRHFVYDMQDILKEYNLKE